MGRREFITFLIGAAAALPLAARAHQLPTVGFLHAGLADGYSRETAGFRKGLNEAGYLDGRNVAIEYRWANGHSERLPDLAADLVRKSVAVIVAAPFAAALSAKRATQTIPIVFEGGADPVGFGLVASLNRPGGNVTGIDNQSNTLVVKQIELMHQLVPSVASIALPADPGVPTSAQFIDDAKKSEALLGLHVQVIQTRTLGEIERAFDRIIELKAGALVVSSGPVFASHLQQIAALATRYRIPASYQTREFATAGGLFSYGTDLSHAYYLAGVYAGRILHGDKPENLPIQLSEKIEMVLNLKTAKALGITFPLPLLGRADEVIE